MVDTVIGPWMRANLLLLLLLWLPRRSQPPIILDAVLVLRLIPVHSPVTRKILDQRPRLELCLIGRPKLEGRVAVAQRIRNDFVAKDLRLLRDTDTQRSTSIPQSKQPEHSDK